MSFRRSLWPAIITVLLLPADLVAQATRAIVLSRTQGAAASSLFDVDLSNGTIIPIGRFALDTYIPLAVVTDRVNRDVVVALQAPTNSSVLVRLRVMGATVTQQTLLTTIPGTVTGVAQEPADRWVATTDGGLYVVDRNGGAARLVAALTNATAIYASALGAVVAQSGWGTGDPQIHVINIDSGATAYQLTFPGHSPLGWTGVKALEPDHAAIFVSQEDGTIARSAGGSPFTVLPIRPPLPAGGAVAITAHLGNFLVLGGAAHPYLKTSADQWPQVAGPFPGDPIDFALRLFPLGAVLPFGVPCGSMRLEPTGGGAQIGNTAFSLRVTRGLPSSPGLLFLGTNDQVLLGARLPVVLPGGCLAHVSSEVAVPSVTDVNGMARMGIGIPNSPSLVRSIVFAQWLQMPSGRIDVSNAVVIHIG